jgi:formyl-CoA transferase
MTLNLKDPDVKERLGVGYPECRAVNPRIVYASVSGFGQDGPYRLRPGFDQIAQGMGGLMWITGLPGQGPVRVGVPIADLASGLYASIGIFIALLEREQTDEGRWVHSSLLEAQIAMLDFQAARWTVSGEVAPQAGNDHPTSIPTGVFPTSDGHINIAASGNTMFGRLCGALGCPELVSHPDYADDESRSKNRAALNRVLGEYTARRPSEEWVVVLNEARVPCGPINSIDRTMTDPQVRHLGIEKVMAHPELGDVGVVGQAATLSRSGGRPDVRLHTPDQGEHTAEVLAALGYDGGAVEALRADGVI